MQCRFILVETSHPGNIGSAARAMKVMGFNELVLVNPKSFPDKQATILSAGADDVLDKARVVSTLDEAIADCELIMGTSAQSRTLPWPIIAPRQLKETMFAQKSPKKIAIIFGRERIGLMNDELAKCHYHIQIPTNSEYTSLNLAAAVQVLAYELNLALNDQSAKVEPEEEYDRLATPEEMAKFYAHMEAALLKIRYLDPRRPKKLKERLMRVFQRAQLEANEIDLLRGIFSRVEQQGE